MCIEAVPIQSSHPIQVCLCVYHPNPTNCEIKLKNAGYLELINFCYSHPGPAPICDDVTQPGSLSLCLSVRPDCLSVCLPYCLSARVPAHPPACQPARPPASLLASPPASHLPPRLAPRLPPRLLPCLAPCLPICLVSRFVCMSARPFVCLSVHLSMWFSLPRSLFITREPLLE